MLHIVSQCPCRTFSCVITSPLGIHRHNISVTPPLCCVFQFFAVIPPSPAGPQPLTEHQQERRATPRTDIPALYADLSQDTQQLAATTDDSQASAPRFPAESSSAKQESGPRGEDSSGSRRQGARRRLLGVESQPVAGAVSFTGAVTEARRGPESEEVPSRAAQRRRPLRPRQPLPGPESPSKAGKSPGQPGKETAGATGADGPELNGEEAMDAMPAPEDVTALAEETDGSPGKTDQGAAKAADESAA